MWDLGRRNRGIFVLISVLSGCVVLYNAWGPILALSVAIVLVVYVCYSLLINDSVLSPQTVVFFEYLKEACRESNVSLRSAFFSLSTSLRKLSLVLYNLYRSHVASKMSRFRKNTYQLSNDNRETSRNSSRFDLTTNQLSPIPKNEFQENRTYDERVVSRLLQNNHSISKLTSTPLLPWRKDSNGPANRGIGLITPTRPLRHETHHTYGQHHASARSNETVYSPEGSPWGTSISPKMRSKGSGIKTVQTVAGPLLASTRYNIDPKVYMDVTSPGLSTRLAKYATEANSKLTHQSQYMTGQFPKVNLNASPPPLISAKNSRVRTPVTVRIAPPETSRYSPPERQKLISDVCRAESRAAPSVAQVLREISLKRHASKEDVSADLAKKQRTEVGYDADFDDLEEMTQKRTREDSPNNDYDTLANDSQVRMVKKTKTPSCFDVLNSFSSSNQYSSGVKRKASMLDLSRSGTPDIEKHFKPSDVVPTAGKIVFNVIGLERGERKPQKHDLNETPPLNMDLGKSGQKSGDLPTVVKGILKSTSGKEVIGDVKQNQSLERHAKEKTEGQVPKSSSPPPNKRTNFTNKLFMKAEPQANERLRTLIQDQENIRAKFTTDDVEEIKKEDIVNMRQTSMKTRLQSMFDAISGKPNKKINPDVIIHAEAASEPTTSQSTPASLATLNSITSTTNVNTSPIATTAVSPTVADSKLNMTTTTKHVTFNLPSSQPPQIPNSSPSKELSSTTLKPNTTVAGNQFGTSIAASTASSTTANAPTSTTISTLNTPITNITSITPASSNKPSNPLPTFATATSSVQNSVLSVGSTGLNVTATTNNGFNLTAPTTVAPKAPVFSNTSSSNYTSVAQNTNTTSSPKLSTSFRAPNLLTSSTIGAGTLTSQSSKVTENTATSNQTSVPMPNFAFGTPKMSSPASTFAGNNQSLANDRQSQAATSGVSASTSSHMQSSIAQSQQPTSNTATTAGGIVAPAHVTAITSSLFPSGVNYTSPQSTSTGGFFTTSVQNSKVQPFIFGSTATTQSSTPAFGSTTVTQNPPSFGSAINFQNAQSPANITTTTQNLPTFSSIVTSSQNPPAFGSAVTTSANSSTFQTVSSSAAPLPAFGSTSVTSFTFTFGNTASQAVTANSVFGTSANSAAPSTVTTAGTNSTFSFGSSGMPNTKPGFPIGTNAAANTVTSGEMGTTTSNQPPPYGSNTSTNVAPLFGTPSTTAPPAFGATSSTATPVFGGTTNTTVPVFGVPSSSTSTPVFGAPSSTATPVFGTTSSTTTSLFGSPATTTTTAMFDPTRNQSTFGAVSSPAAPSGFGTPKSTAPPAFGSHTSESGFNYGGSGMGGNIFTGTSQSSTPSTALATVSSTFGANTATSNVFGQTKPPPSFAASTTNFGSTAAPSFGTSNTNFGASSNLMSAGTTSAFGGQNSTTPAFGAQNPATKQNPSAPPPIFESSTSAFGANTCATPTFGANTTTTSGFASAAALFRMQNTNVTNFGAAPANTGAAFGTNVSATFGGQNEGAISAFGAQNSTGPSFGASSNTATTGFGFGGNQTQTQQTSGFSFGGSAPNANNNATTAAPFQFGGAPAKPEGFNFNASTTTPNLSFGSTTTPSFGAPNQSTIMFGAASPAIPAGGMFSIGAGSTAPRSRASRPRRQR